MAVALNVPKGDGLFTYRLPPALGAGEIGRRVQVPLGRRTATGVIVGDGSAHEKGQVRNVLRLLDDGPLLPPEVIELVQWAAAHYVAPLGPAIKAALPPGIDERDDLRGQPTQAGRALLEQGTLVENAERSALQRLSDGHELPSRILRALERRGLVELVPGLTSHARVSVKRLEVAQAVPGAQLPLRAPRQAALLEWLLARGTQVPVAELLVAFPKARALLKALVQRGLATLAEVDAGPVQLEEAPWGTSAHAATPAQAAALRTLEAALGAGCYAPFLLHGVTGSGKTLVYLEAIARARSLGLGAIALVPEIALTPQLAGRFRARFGDDVAVLHSGLSERERLTEWHRVREGRAGVVVGARSAVFAPVKRVGIIVVDEEHEPSYKQDERLRYHARDLALVRAQRAHAVAVLGSATPSLETLQRVREGKLSLLVLPERATARPLPAIEVVDRKGCQKLFTPQLSKALLETLSRGEQAILFLNKRGHTRTLLCQSCGAAVGCPNCSVALVLHLAGGTRLRCHLCGHQERERLACAACSSRKLEPLGAGTERAEEELRALAPGARVQRLDRDAAGGPGQAAAILARFARRELDVLIGTQMVAKGHDFPGVTLVGVLDADGALHQPDFRAAERCVQLIAQVAGRAGRGAQPGRVVVQAFKPEDPAVRAGSHYAEFAQQELVRREALGFPPFSRLAALKLQGNVELRVKAAAERLAAHARKLVSHGEEADVLGPAPAPLARLRGKHRFQLLLRAKDHGPLHRLSRALLREHDERGPSGVALSVDVDPVALL